MQTQLFIALVIAMVALLGFAWYTWPEALPVSMATSEISTSNAAASSTDSRYPSPALGEDHGVVTINGKTIYVDIAVTQAQQELGLGNRASLGADQGMLFVFPKDSLHMFWMKDMSFSIDMLWLSSNGTIIYIQPNVAPSTYPTAFGPKSLSRYVLEVPANFSAQNHLKVGDKTIIGQ